MIYGSLPFTGSCPWQQKRPSQRAGRETTHRKDVSTVNDYNIATLCSVDAFVLNEITLVCALTTQHVLPVSDFFLDVSAFAIQNSLLS